MAPILVVPVAAPARGGGVQSDVVFRWAAGLAGAERACGPDCRVMQVTRENLDRHVVHHRMLLKVGPADHLAELRVPLLYTGMAAGFGRFGEYTTELLGSRDITNLMIQLQPDPNAATDFGHMDSSTAEDARELVWQPIHAWIVAHNPGQLKHRKRADLSRRRVSLTVATVSNQYPTIT